MTAPSTLPCRARKKSPLVREMAIFSCLNSRIRCEKLFGATTLIAPIVGPMSVLQLKILELSNPRKNCSTPKSVIELIMVKWPIC